MSKHSSVLVSYSSNRNGSNKTLLGETAAFFKVLGDPTRLSIVYALSEGELCVNDISETVGISVSAVSHQLAQLRRAKLVNHRREGKLVFYQLNDEHVGTILATAREHLSE